MVRRRRRFFRRLVVLSAVGGLLGELRRRQLESNERTYFGNK